LELLSEFETAVWADTTSKARNAILSGAIALPQTFLESDAQEFAFRAAKRLGVAGQSNVLSAAVDVTLSLGFPSLLALIVTPWAALLAPISPVAIRAFRYFSGASPGDHLARAARSTRQNFRTLATIPPGRIERHLKDNSP
jgi:hypothetical protein